MAGVSRMAAQGGPPMLTDDPGTPGPNKWEINVGWTTQEYPGLTETGAPQLDVNYGLGDRIELTYFATYTDDRGDGGASRWGMSDSELAVKWRFYDGGDHGLQVSVYPEAVFLTPGSRSDRRGIADGNTGYVLPFQFQRNFKWLSVNVDCGHTFGTGTDGDGWFGGICVGREVRKGWEIDAEVHVNADEGVGHTESVGNVATRIDLFERCTLMLLLGRDLKNQLGPRASLLSYVGIQLRL
jgi:hypothetical protein